MYYVVEIDLQELDDYAYLDVTPDDDPDKDRLDWETGESLSKQRRVGQLSANTSDEKGIEFKDVFPNEFDGIILNKGCIDFLKSIGVNNLEEFPLTITNHETGEKINDYCMYNIIGKISCLDRKASVFEESTIILGQIEEFEKLVLNINNIDEFNKKMGGNGPLKMFRMAENLFLVIAHEDVKTAIEKANITGWVFTETSLYEG